ncbi:hypothetical protein GUITHDRAFT_133144 [Guillardia theta CCMP2712]|uniref:Uncharacterized protein n=1 Tax=Guillardia theta (strain CCMP2712) TaxID=905079 RepID=L1JXY1_GUITC|nr:hypothetical protein GUITHDRAFT_133144 [Guillardia theta CCMP2712]EKX53426.1 hypothetical protein GUITHDRAFT_133144 [Guillardia theta CCMP2712]|eukprot:XP_005840406.1 hypothetical protein GUITHDRAFT_133144 [Guillardia theta CCMP2712]
MVLRDQLISLLLLLLLYAFLSTRHASALDSYGRMGAPIPTMQNSWKVLLVGDFICSTSRDRLVLQSFAKLGMISETMHVQVDEMLEGTLHVLLENFRPDFLFFSFLSNVEEQEVCVLMSVWKTCRSLGISTIILHQENADPMQYQTVATKKCSTNYQDDSDLATEWLDFCVRCVSVGPLISSQSCDHLHVNPSPGSGHEYEVAFVVVNKQCKDPNQSTTDASCELYWLLKDRYHERIQLLAVDEDGFTDKSSFVTAKVAVATVTELAGELEGDCFSRSLGIRHVYGLISEGTFVIHNLDPSIASNLKNGTHVITYNTGDYQSLTGIIDYFLQHGDERDIIAKQGMQQVCIHNTIEEFMGNVMQSLYESSQPWWFRCKAEEEEATRSDSTPPTLLNAARERLTIYHEGAQVPLDVIHKSTWDRSQYRLGRVSCLEDDCDVVLKNYPYLRESHSVAAEGIFVALYDNMTIVHDGVFCNATQKVTAFKYKHETHPDVPEGCLLEDSDNAIRHVSRALSLLANMGWFWGHFVHDLLFRLSYAINSLDFNFDIVLEGNSHANIVMLVEIVTGGKNKIHFYDTECLRGNGRSCREYLRVRELLVVNTLLSLFVADDVVPFEFKRTSDLIYRNLANQVLPCWKKQRISVNYAQSHFRVGIVIGFS